VGIKTLQALLFSIFILLLYGDNNNRNIAGIIRFTFRLTMAHMVVTILMVAFGYTQISESYPGNIFDLRSYSNACLLIFLSITNVSSTYNSQN
jgi:hypothetical protein